ncbi:hypothetical protein ACTMTF_33615 [Nonomuraea sp. ZG12]|uniref:hypothetical protein n=1 Tax=Nonomuraea sp. ZG12 TaxID=3452207 RepID=UPI003F8AFA75
MAATGIADGRSAELVRTRYSAGDVARLLVPARWDRPAEHITQHLRVLMSGTVDDLEKIAQ